MTRKVSFCFIYCILDLVNVNFFVLLSLGNQHLHTCLKLRYSKFESLKFLFDLRYDYSHIQHLNIKNIIMKKSYISSGRKYKEHRVNFED